MTYEDGFPVNPPGSLKKEALDQLKVVALIGIPVLVAVSFLFGLEWEWPDQSFSLLILASICIPKGVKDSKWRVWRDVGWMVLWAVILSGMTLISERPWTTMRLIGGIVPAALLGVLAALSVRDLKRAYAEAAKRRATVVADG